VYRYVVPEKPAINAAKLFSTAVKCCSIAVFPDEKEVKLV
jgi:hypothetical protein